MQAAVPALAAGLLAGAAIFVPPLLREREVVDSSPVPPPLFQLTEVGLLPGEPEICLADVALGPRSKVLRFRIAGLARPGARIRVAASGPGYRAGPVSAVVRSDGPLDVPFSPPARELRGRICLTLENRRPLTFAGTLERRTRARPRTFVVGREVEADITTIVLAGGKRSQAERPGEMLRHASAFKPGVVSPALLTVLAALMVVAVPVGALWALRRGAD